MRCLSLTPRSKWKCHKERDTCVLCVFMSVFAVTIKDIKPLLSEKRGGGGGGYHSNYLLVQFKSFKSCWPWHCHTFYKSSRQFKSYLSLHPLLIYGRVKIENLWHWIIVRMVNKKKIFYINWNGLHLLMIFHLCSFSRIMNCSERTSKSILNLLYLFRRMFMRSLFLF